MAIPAWLSVFVLPNIHVKDPIDADVAVIADSSDARVQQVLSEIPVLDRFLRSFTTQAGYKIHPSLMIMQNDAPKGFFSVEAVSSLRDLIAMSVIPLARANSAVHGRPFATQYSDFYEFYPWTINTMHQHLVCNTPALMGIEQAEQFRGQSDPGLGPVVLQSHDFDTVLLKLLLTRWKRHYGGKSKKWANTALFRSLNMAVAAAKMPATVEVRLFDLGRAISLWVSAFEILAHPRVGKSGLPLVYGLLEKAPWHSDRMKERRYRAYDPRQPKKSSPRSLPCWLYGEIYQARNDFFHGNPIRITRLNVRGSGRSLFFFPPMLYRMALAAYLPIKANLKVPSPTAKKAYAKYVTKFFEIFEDQRQIEQGIRTVRQRIKKPTP